MTSPRSTGIQNLLEMIGRFRPAVILAVALACAFLLDSWVYQVVHDHYNERTRPIPWFLRTTTRILRSMEDWGENVYIAAVAAAVWLLDRRRRGLLLPLVLASLLVALSVEGVKRLAGRARPEVSLGKTDFRGPVSGFDGGDYQSFPSGHSAAAGVYSGWIAAAYPPLRPVAVLLAGGCAANRIWKERHFLSDCLFGAAFGYWFVGWFMRRDRVRAWTQWLSERLAPGSPPGRQEQVWVIPAT